MNSFAEFEYEVEGETFVAEIPTKYEVCDECEGFGTVLCEGMRDYAYSAEEFNESFDDEEREEYFKRGGRYDVKCPNCGGLRVVSQPDFDAQWPKHDGPDELDLKTVYKREQRRKAEDARERAYERKMGA
jgi:hypothetical protein